MGARAQSCLIVDDDRLAAEELMEMVAELGFAGCALAHDTQTAIEMAINLQPEVILMDVRLGEERDGVEAAVEILKRTRSRIIFVTGYVDPRTISSMRRSNPNGVLSKPVDPRELKRALLG